MERNRHWRRNVGLLILLLIVIILGSRILDREESRPEDTSREKKRHGKSKSCRDTIFRLVKERGKRRKQLVKSNESYGGMLP